MQIHLIAVGTRMPDWVETGFDEYAKRMPPECRLNLIEIPAGKRSKNVDTARLIEQEGQRMLAAIPKNSKVIAMDVEGAAWSTGKLATQMSGWMQGGQDVVLLVGGPEGLAPDCRKLGQPGWSLSPLTLPHPLVRIVLAEQLYRAISILKNHPYHK
ncbi:MAG: 23S rRNA (pseudouridine(1915)-N(3))-methyltransferase RlmH [Gammaproteobacteria bacterium]|nr:23S rRNA (pseudouridine(1915)-N(3))-methyltransferase RlmH [Gammaproteobacteria bacterium]